VWHPVLAVATKAVELLRVASQRGGLATTVEGGVPPVLGSAARWRPARPVSERLR